jgi:hypothetical protein
VRTFVCLLHRLLVLNYARIVITFARLYVRLFEATAAAGDGISP